MCFEGGRGGLTLIATALIVECVIFLAKMGEIFLWLCIHMRLNLFLAWIRCPEKSKDADRRIGIKLSSSH